MFCRFCWIGYHRRNMGESATNGGTYTKAYCLNCKAIREIRKDQIAENVLEIVCTVCFSVIATLYK
jgi:hypothetical protein